jgi:hypothetical protein
MPDNVAEPLTPEFGVTSRQVLRSTTVATEGSGRRGMWGIKRIPVGPGQVDRRDGSGQCCRLSRPWALFRDRSTNQQLVSRSNFPLAQDFL